jgi:hypothetical protein
MKSKKEANPLTPEEKQKAARNWWNFQTEDEQIWLMMQFGFAGPFNPKKVKIDEMVQMHAAATIDYPKKRNR